MKQLKEHYQYILANGTPKPGRSGSFDTPDSSLSVFGRQLRFDLKEGLPFVTSKELKTQAMTKELTWMIRGETNTSTLGSKIWDKWALSRELRMRVALPEQVVVQQLLSLNLIELDQPATTPDGIAVAMHKGSAYLANLAKQHYRFPDEYDEEQITQIREMDVVRDDLVYWPAVDEVLLGLGVQVFNTTTQYLPGDCGPIYGQQWRNYKSVTRVDGQERLVYTDQFMAAYDTLVSQPHSRRNIVSAWNPGLVPQSGHTLEENIASGLMGLPPCHRDFQLWVGGNPNHPTLSLMLALRSSDSGVGLPFNIGAYALLTHLFALEFNYGVGELVINIGDAHIYTDHITPIQKYLEAPEHPLPTFWPDHYEAKKQSVIVNWINESHTTACDSQQNPLFTAEQIPSLVQQELDSLTIRGDEAPELQAQIRRRRFEMFINHIPASFFDDAIVGYESEPHIPMSLHD